MYSRDNVANDTVQTETSYFPLKASFVGSYHKDIFNALGSAIVLCVLLSAEEVVTKKYIFGTFHVLFQKSSRKDSTKHLTSHYKLLVWKWQRGLFHYFISLSPYQPPSYQHPLQITHCNYPPPHFTTHTYTLWSGKMPSFHIIQR